jgi:hypothetical protein
MKRRPVTLSRQWTKIATIRTTPIGMTVVCVSMMMGMTTELIVIWEMIATTVIFSSTQAGWRFQTMV